MKRISSAIVENKAIENFSERAAIIYKKLKENNDDSPISLRYLSSKFSVPKSTIHRAVEAISNGRQVGKRGRPISINPVISQILLKWIEERREILLPPSVNEIQEKIVEEIRKQNPEIEEEKCKISRRTVKRYLIQNGLCLKYATSTKKEGVLVSRNTIKTYLTKLHKLCTINGYQPRNIFNMDELWVDSSDIRSQTKVVGNVEESSIQMEGTEGKHFTVIGCICLDGSYIKPRYLCPYSTYNLIKIDKYDITDIDAVECLSGWMNEDQLMMWMENIFIPEVNKKRDAANGERVLLLLDAHPSRYSLEFI